jgi:hypothetical protein
MTATLFILYLGLIAAIVIGLALRYLPRSAGVIVSVGLPFWLLYVGSLGWFGVVKPVPGQPPGVLLIFIPLILFIALVLVRSAAGLRVALALPLWLLLGLQTFRIGVELFLHQFWVAGLAPKMLTYEGANVDILVGVTAPLFAWIATKGRVGLRIAMLWNILGLCSLINVIVSSVLTAPGPLNILQGDVPNLVSVTFPYIFLPGFFPPLAISLHVLAIRAIRKHLRDAKEPSWSATAGEIT